jgi:GTP-binding protein HflX
LDSTTFGAKKSDSNHLTETATIVSFPDLFTQAEIRELAKAAGYHVTEIITQRRIIKSEFGVGVGKAEELKNMVEENGSKTIIVDEKLTSSQANNLSKVTHAEVIDRERLILNIFAKRAATVEAKLQVQLAELKYEMPRARDEVRYSVKGERMGFSGMGETAVDVRFKALRRQMVFINQKLKKARTQRQLQRAQRQKLQIPFISLAGYTSSGKTTLFNKLASETKEESPSLFTTLSTTTRAVRLFDSEVLLSDSVGFISRLPTYLIESFKSTLEELNLADLILLIVDASESSESIQIKLESSFDILKQLGVDQERILLVLNKMDLAKRENVDVLEKEYAGHGFKTVRISAVRGDGLHRLKLQIKESLKTETKNENQIMRA